MQNDRRTGDAPVPANLRQYLNDYQMLALDRMMELGWELKFVRRPIFQQPIPVIHHAGNKEHAIIEEDGTINKDLYINIR